MVWYINCDTGSCFSSLLSVSKFLIDFYVFKILASLALPRNPSATQLLTMVFAIKACLDFAHETKCEMYGHKPIPGPIRLRQLKCSWKLKENKRGEQACIFIEVDLWIYYFCVRIGFFLVISKWFKSCLWGSLLSLRGSGLLTVQCAELETWGFSCCLGHRSAGWPWVNHLTCIYLSPMCNWHGIL